ncbi:MAG TPA: hypothetical protein PK199_07125 [Bacteroidales bacterium]|nr:hypothetical protein [Bacteroidales bacterium]
MKLRNLTLYFLFVFLVFNTKAQNLYDIKIPTDDYIKRCQECITLINSKPVEIQYGVKKDNMNNLYFYVTQKDWFDAFFKKGGDGIAIDIVSKDLYDCSIDKYSKTNVTLGELQNPVYLKDLKKNMQIGQRGEVICYIGTLPEKYWGKEVEYNIVFLKDKYLCHYNRFLNIEAYRWDIMDMGLYFDSLSYKNDFDTARNKNDKFMLHKKTLRFEIPFTKNKSEYTNTDIKPLYDSLNLTDFNISKITIRAYSSVEGDLERNIILQQARAQSIVNVMQSYQSPTLITEIYSNENWVEFLNDISTTTYANLAGLSKEEIKKKLNDKQISQDLEPILAKHRKAIIILELEKKDLYKNLSVTELVEMFSKSITDKNINRAIEIQNSLFEKVKNHEASIENLEQLAIPKQSEYSILLNKDCIFKYLMDESEVYTTYKELLELKDIMPKNPQIRYNLCAIQFRVWLLGDKAINPVEFKKEISNLKSFGISSQLIKRMLINYEIIMCEYYMLNRDYVNKDKSLKYIYSNFQTIPLSDFDYLSLAQYFSSYSKYDWAIKLLEKRVKTIDVNEDLLFYYINLTIGDEKITKQQSYRTIMLNAYNLNKTRYCKIFNSIDNGGVSFQLLENDFLRKTYCENCR